MLLLVAGLAAASAQQGPEVHARHVLATSAEPGAQLPVNTTGLQVNVWSMGLSTPTPPIRLVPDTWTLVNLLDFDYTRLSYTAADEATFSTDRADLFRVRWSLVTAWTPGDRLSLAVVLRPGLYSDFGGPLSAEDVGYAGIAVGYWAFGDNLSVGLGGGLVNFFGLPTWTPFAGIKAQAGRFRADVFLPQSAKLWVDVAEPVAVGVQGTIDGGFYHVHIDQEQLPDEVYQKYSLITVGPVVQVVLRDKLAVDLDGAYGVSQQLEVYRDRDTELFELELEPTWSVGAKVTVVVGE